jgi:hypothetical protein
MRHPAGGRHGPDVDQYPNPMALEKLDKLLDRSGRVTNGEDYVRCDGSTAGTSTCFVMVVPFSWKVPEKRNAGS